MFVSSDCPVLWFVAVEGTHCCHVHVPPFCSLDWRTCLWPVLFAVLEFLCFSAW